jgi:type IV fimbrial biogenesis protein FimT
MNHSQRGLGLIESMIVTSIVIAMTAAAVPGVSSLFDRLRVTTAAADFRVALTLSRNEAMRRRERVDLLPLRHGDWRSGWQVVIDANNNQVADVGERVLRVSPALPVSLDISARLTDAKRVYIAFDPTGRPRTAASAATPQFGSVVFQSGEHRRKVVIGFLGRARTCDPDRDGAAC